MSGHDHTTPRDKHPTDPRLVLRDWAASQPDDKLYWYRLFESSANAVDAILGLANVASAVMDDIGPGSKEYGAASAIIDEKRELFEGWHRDDEENAEHGYVIARLMERHDRNKRMVKEKVSGVRMERLIHDFTYDLMTLLRLGDRTGDHGNGVRYLHEPGHVDVRLEREDRTRAGGTRYELVRARFGKWTAEEAE